MAGRSLIVDHPGLRDVNTEVSVNNGEEGNSSDMGNKSLGLEGESEE